MYARHGLDAWELGDEAIVETSAVTLDGRATRTVRQAYDRVKPAAYTVRVRRQADIPDDEMAHLGDRTPPAGRERSGSRRSRSTSPCSGRSSNVAGASAPGRYRDCDGHSSAASRAAGRSSRCAGPTPSTGPSREPRFLLFEKSADLPRIAIAAARAEGFPEAPGLPKWLHRKHLESHR